MPLKGKACIRLAHPFPIVNNLNGCFSGISDDDGYLRGSGIKAVFHKFLDDRCRTLDNFTSRYLIGYAIWK